jgi:glycerate kinase
MKILIAPDSFKGSLSAKEVADSVERGLTKCNASLSIEKLPLGDGGEGTLDALSSGNVYTKEKWFFNDPFVGKRNVEVGVAKGQVYLESASVLGLPWFEAQSIPFGKRNSRALGILIQQGIERGYRSFQIGLGGTGCHDWGLGLAHELGVRFYDRDRKLLEAAWNEPTRIYDFAIHDIELNINALSDIDAPLTGKRGAALCYASQKGATDINSLEETALHLLEVVNKVTGKNLTELKGGGAAGGLGLGLAAFFDARIKSGIQTVAENLELEKHVAESDIIITGEGKIDGQSFNGKVLSGVLALAKKHKKPMVLVCGKNEAGQNLPDVVIGVFETSAFAETQNESISSASLILGNDVASHVYRALENR